MNRLEEFTFKFFSTIENITQTKEGQPTSAKMGVINNSEKYIIHPQLYKVKKDIDNNKLGPKIGCTIYDYV